VLIESRRSSEEIKEQEGRKGGKKEEAMGKRNG
jgi:hypothetical protein